MNILLDLILVMFLVWGLFEGSLLLREKISRWRGEMLLREVRYQDIPLVDTKKNEWCTLRLRQPNGAWFQRFADSCWNLRELHRFRFGNKNSA